MWGKIAETPFWVFDASTLGEILFKVGMALFLLALPTLLIASAFGSKKADAIMEFAGGACLILFFGGMFAFVFLFVPIYGAYLFLRSL